MFKRYQLLSLLAILAAPSHSVEFDDWITTRHCKNSENRLCKGYYEQPVFEIEDGSSEKQITITSDQGEFVAKGRSNFLGNVVAKQGNKIIYADRTVVEHNDDGKLETITAYGNVRIIQPGIRVDGDKAVSKIDLNQKIIDEAYYRIYDSRGRGFATTLTITDNDKMSLTNSTYTTCAPNSNAWKVKSKRTEINKTTGRGEAWHSKLYVREMPVFYWPYLNIPIDDRRQTGFLQPSFESTQDSGSTFIVPFYWNMAPNYDSTITTNYMSKRGWKFDTQFRFLTKQSEGKIYFDFLPDDDVYKNLRKTKLADSGFINAAESHDKLRRNDLRNSNFRYRYGIEDKIKINEHLSLSVDYHEASDGNYLFDFFKHQRGYLLGKTSPTHALQQGTVTYTDYWGTLRYQLQQYETFHVVDGPSGEQQLRKLPEITYNSSSYEINNFSMRLDSVYTDFKTKVVNDSEQLLSFGERWQVRPALSYPYQDVFWHITPRVQLNHVEYSNMHLSPQDKLQNKYGTSMTIPIYDVRGGLIFERDTIFNKNDFIQTLEPELYYLYVPERNQDSLPIFDTGINTFDYYQVYRDNRYSGFDRVSEADQLGIGVSSQFLEADSGEQKAMLGIGRIRYFRDRILRLDEISSAEKHWSPLAMFGRWNVNQEYSIEGNFVRERQQTLLASITARYQPTPTNVINISYQSGRSVVPDNLHRIYETHVKQIIASTAWEVTPKLRVLGRIEYDLRFKRSLANLVGFEYHTCCTAVRFVWQRDWEPHLVELKRNNFRMRLQVIFKGLGGGVGNAQDRYISGLIPGYQA